MANDNKDNNKNDSTVASDRNSTPTTVKEIGLEGEIGSNDDNINDNSVTSDETNSTAVSSDSIPTTEEEVYLNGEIDTDSNDQDDIILISHETNSCDQPPDSLPTTENEPSPEIVFDSSFTNVDVSIRGSEKVQTGKSPKSVSEVFSSKTEVPSTEDYFLQNLPVANELATDTANGLEEEESVKIRDIVQNDNIDIHLRNELTTDEAEWSEESNALGDAYKVQDRDEEISDIPSVEEEEHYSDEESSENLSIVQEEENESDDGESSIPDGDTTDDLYALLAMSKKRLAKTEIDEKDKKTEVDEEEDGSRCKDEECNELLDNGTSNMHHADVNKLKQVEHNDENKSMVDKDDSEKEPNDDDDDDYDGSISYTSASIKSAGNDEKVKEESQNLEQGDKQKKEKHNAELWALLNYSKQRLSTGATPTTTEGEGKNLDVDIDDGLSFGDDELRASQSTFDIKDHLNDTDEDDLSLSDDVAVPYGIDENARARALAALEKVSVQQVRLSDKQLRQSVKLAEEAARTGAPEFRTSNNLSALDKVSLTDKFRRNRGGNVNRRRRSGERRVRSNAMKEKFSNFKVKLNLAFDDFKKTCERASTMKE